MVKSMIDVEQDLNLEANDIVVVGCSTGPDSMALLDMILKKRDKYNLVIIVAHINHNLRKESEKEATFIRDYCLKNNLLFEYMKIDKYGDDNFHNEARNIRYSFFDNVVEKHNAKYLLTAHHGDDLVETVLMRLARGSNLSGYSGFHKEKDMGDYKIVRPLIRYTKEELEEYNKQNKVSYFIDSSNKKDKYTRNRYRKVILPFLKEEEKNIHLKFLKFSEELIEASKYIEKKREQALSKVLKDNELLIDKFIELDKYLQKEILYYMMYDFYLDDLILVNNKHIDLLLELIYSSSTKANLSINLPNDVIAIKSYSKLLLKRQTDEITGYEIELSKYVKLPNNHTLEIKEEVVGNSNNICRLNSKEISLPLIVRTRRFGDKMYIKGLNGSKKIKDIFIDKKLSLKNRDMWPIVVDSKNVVVFIPGIKKSKFDKKSCENYDIIIEYN